ncbi:MAG: acetylxylan esterase [Pirellulaceae bacterium]|nr:acetylxylan esterase [Pirellulaceae bacterium]
MCYRAAVLILAVFHVASAAAVVADEALVKTLKQLDTRVCPCKDEQKLLTEMLGKDILSFRKFYQELESEAWAKVKSKVDWEKFRNQRLEFLKPTWQSEGPMPPDDLKIKITRTFQGDGYLIENLVFESRPGLLVTANLYQPAQPRDSMPGILICHSHHAPKTQGELQDMGISWAKQGCLVLVMDQLGHGERRQHAFKTAADYAGEFRPSRQDYFFRYNSGMQLHLIGESLIGWMANDLSRGVDLLLRRDEVDEERIILLGAVAGGGDPAAVAAALDQRISAVVPFNFGGPQPETTYPLPPNVEQTFNYFGSGSWESTRNISRSISGGCAPWVIVGAAAPRRLVYAHEFAWDQEHDPAWKRLKTIYSFYEAEGNLASTRGEGSVRGSGAGNTHCTNIGPIHRVAIDGAFLKWFKIEKPAHDEMPHRKADELACLTEEMKPTPLHELAARIGRTRASNRRENLAQPTVDKNADAVRDDWTALLGEVQPRIVPKVQKSLPIQKQGSVTIERLALEVDPGILVPLVLLRPAADKPPVVIAVSQHGKSAFLKERAAAIAELLESGIAVCLPDLRGTGETSPDDGRGRNSTLTSYSSSLLMLGGTLVGSRVRDSRSVLRYLRGRQDFDNDRMALWGDSFAPVNAAEKDLAAPLDAANPPPSSEPLGGLVVLLTALFDSKEEVRAVYARGSLVSFQSLFESPYVYVPHDVIIPGAIPFGDLPVVMEVLSSRKIRFSRQVDGQNRLVKPEEGDEPSPAAWLKEALK